MKNIAQKLKKVKKPSECHQSDVYSETYHLAKMRANYEKAREELAVQPYSQRMKPLDNFLYGFRSVYHFISVILGLATCVLISLVFVGTDLDSNGQFPPWMLVLMALLIGGLLVGLLVAVELAKITFAKNIFKAKAKRDRIGNFSIVGLAFLVFVSIALSGVGGALLSFKMGDKTKALTQDLKASEQKVTQQYDARLKQLNEVIAGLENLSVDKKARRWGLTKEEQANLQASKNEKQQILAKKEQKLNSLNTKHTAEVKANQDYTSTTMYVALGLITVLELITIYAYFFHFQYLARTEQEGVQFDILSDNGAAEKPQEMMVETLVNRISDALLATQAKATPVQDLVQALEQRVTQLTNKAQETPALATQPHNEISLRPSSMRNQEATDPRAINQNAPKGTVVECSNSACNKTFTKKSKNHKYCSPGCRSNKSFNLSISSKQQAARPLTNK